MNHHNTKLSFLADLREEIFLIKSRALLDELRREPYLETRREREERLKNV